MINELSNKTSLVTGAANGIGRIFALGLADAGATVILVDVDSEGLRKVEAEIAERNGKSLPRAIDISNVEAVEGLQRELTELHGEVDILVNNAAIGPERNSPTYLLDKPKFWTTQDSLWLSMLRVNIFGAQLMSKTFVRHMLEKRWGRIINITTSLDTMYRPGIGPYGPCKAALEALSRVMCQDLDGTGVTTNVLVPGGPVNTRMVPAECGFSTKELIQPEQMLPPLLWLCSTEADKINGSRIVAQKWKEERDPSHNLREASAPIAWPQLGAQSLFPGNQFLVQT
ncbi:SDR family NAD(P)-dependent oxidoreductase [Ralstonia soli]|uniref:SDR family oxidoreductase n=1 Tax=Ralstonia soli TaxID=2953896 RepID=A0ABT1AE89_9RALS|nr:SDR family oxidoreductase [Ralstonia soli]MCO5396633.1 SDR family oxidoreductase [Ralstonia soli]